MSEPYQDETMIELSAILSSSFQRLLGYPLVDGTDSATNGEMAKALWYAPFTLLAHNSAPDPLFIYANRHAQALFGYTWHEFMRLPSRLSAEPDAQEDRERLLQRAEEQGYVENYGGIRKAKDGRHFRIDDVILWNLSDRSGQRIGQAALIREWQLL